MELESVPNESEGRKTSFARNSGQIRQKRTFLNLQGLNLCTSHILVFGCLRDQDVVGLYQKVEGNFLLPRLLSITYGGTFNM